MGARLPCLTGPGEHSQILNPHALAHFFQKFFRHRPVDCHGIFFFMVITTAEDFIHNISLICHKEQPFRVLIQASHRINPLRIMKKFHNIFRMVLIRSGADNPFGLVDRQKHRRFLSTYCHSIADHLLSRLHLMAHKSHSAIHQYFSLFDKPVRFSPGTDSGIT